MIDQYHTAPLKIAKSFRLPEEPGALYVHMMDASPGILDGDHYDLDFHLEPGSHVYLTNQSYTKIHPTPAGSARMTQHFTVDSGAVLEYFPEPTIPYRDSRFISETRFDLAQDSIVFYGEVTTPGRTHHGERFAFTTFDSQTAAYREGLLVNWDHFLLEPGHHRFEEIGALDGYTHHATLWIWAPGVSEEIVKRIREAVGSPEDVYWGVSLSGPSAIALRLLARNVWQAQSVITVAWSAARIMLLGKAAPVIRR
jgi:urease accessory protein